MPEGIPYSSTNVIAGTGLDLNYIGNHCYAYSGEFEASTSDQTVLNFTTGSKYIVGELFVSGPIEPGASTGAITTFIVKMNGINAILLKVDSAQEDQPNNEKVKLILPPYTNLTVITDSDANSSSRHTTTAFTGEVH